MSRQARSDGFTVLEVLVALFVIGLVLLSVTPMFVHASRANAGGADLGSCGALAMERMETLRRVDFASLSVGGDLDSDVTDFFDTSHAGFVVRWEISNAAAPANARRIAVRATSLRATAGRSKQSTLVTLRVP